MMYNGGLPRYRRTLAAVAAEGYPTFDFASERTPVAVAATAGAVTSETDDV